ncbi:diguanylate cyclase (GGDEF) domain protein [Fibrobacter succinogenes subsp. succinogenes S85]|uniref:diguanylate cyclase n=1 Tax=Fibrobacter succinogenes (strain ATCC 19169 / S85) TaxID=59374 RepID=C9RKW9_FIBSS|nr:sensor domain-containing diguanylate cyclase [Fibrobacter succinogenes]ACX75917.1 diguanylate cyclase [Fibrobacter succinogenes subsp. succinogenes S85]ADL25898.1 diguanylate cyclase (GGDEF) domain protein [Fibrobacter succinogenes subsp. succinogenes S85]
MMDLQKFVDNFHTMTSILSVEKRDDDRIGTIRIEAANDLYIRAMEKVDKDGNVVFKEKFVPGSSYERYMKKELNFENFCYECAIKKKPVHAYIRPERYTFCINLYMMPLAIDDPKKAYCSYSQEITFEENVDAMSNISAKTSSNVLQTCIKLRSTKNLQKTMDEVIEDIRKICDASYCCVMLTDFKDNTWSVFSDALKPDSGIRSIRELKSENFVDYARSWIKTLNGSNCLIIKNKDDLEVIHQENPAWYNSLVAANVNSLVLLPLEYNGLTLGFFWATNFDTSNTLYIRETLELSAFFVASEIANYQLLNQLELLSSMDLLTGVMNRNSMNNRVTQFLNGEVQYKSLGIIFADLNGLKPVNDNKGHDAGDKLLKDASQLLKFTFDGCEFYRAGGDEFLIIALDKSKEELEAKVKTLREKSMIPGKVSFAIGFYYDANGGDIRTAMHEADVRMYEDKKRYYDRFPANRKRL